MSKPALFFCIRKKSGTFSFRFVLFCFVMLLGSPARGQSETEDKLAPRDTVEIFASNWGALRGGRFPLIVATPRQGAASAAVRWAG